MRKFTRNQGETQEIQMLAVTPIDEIEFDLQDRDEITKILIGLQEIYRNASLRDHILRLLDDQIEYSSQRGRMGMDMWTIFVLGVLRLGCNWNYDTLYNIYSHHGQIRMMTGLDPVFDQARKVSRSTLNENMMVFTEPVLREINHCVVAFGHQQIINEEVEVLHTRSDSFALLKNVHFPTDFNLLYDSCRKIMSIGAPAAINLGLVGWREHASLLSKLKKQYTKVSKLRKSTSKKESVVEKRNDYIKSTISNYLLIAGVIIGKVTADLDKFSVLTRLSLDLYLDHATRFADQINRRIFKGETIPPNEKIFSIFESDTEWICKGKAGVRQELGVRFAIMEDQFGFIIHSRMMHHEQDVDIAIDFVKDAKAMFPDLASNSYDKGFHSAKDENGEDNRSKIEALGVICNLPKKGRRTKEETQRESTDEFIKMRKQHSAVESAINALESHGLDRCPDKGAEHFDRYALLGVLSSNIHNIGKILQNRRRLAEAA